MRFRSFDDIPLFIAIAKCNLPSVPRLDFEPEIVAKRRTLFSKTPPERSHLMSRIRGRGNATTELAVVQIFRTAKISGWRRHYRGLPGTPDFVFPAAKLAVFLDGCFWHGCPRCYRKPRTNAEYWGRKVMVNTRRDRRVARELRARGWRVLRIWEHAISKPGNVVRRVTRMLN